MSNLFPDILPSALRSITDVKWLPYRLLYFSRCAPVFWITCMNVAFAGRVLQSRSFNLHIIKLSVLLNAVIFSVLFTLFVIDRLIPYFQRRLRINASETDSFKLWSNRGTISKMKNVRRMSLSQQLRSLTAFCTKHNFVHVTELNFEIRYGFLNSGLCTFIAFWVLFLQFAFAYGTFVRYIRLPHRLPFCQCSCVVCYTCTLHIIQPIFILFIIVIRITTQNRKLISMNENDIRHVTSFLTINSWTSFAQQLWRTTVITVSFLISTLTQLNSTLWFHSVSHGNCICISCRLFYSHSCQHAHLCTVVRGK